MPQTTATLSIIGTTGPAIKDINGVLNKVRRIELDFANGVGRVEWYEKDTPDMAEWDLNDIITFTDVITGFAHFVTITKT
jgi:hypothetical protein